MSDPVGGSGGRGLVRGPQSFVAGLGLIGLGLFAIWAGSDLSRGTLGAIGPGLMPYWLAIGVMACGAALCAAGFLQDGAPLQSMPLRGPVVIILAILIFAVTIRPFAFGSVTTPGLGLAVAGPLAVLVAGYASHEARFTELLILGLLLTAGCMLLFGDLLNLPIPMLPTALIQALAGTLPSRTLLRIAAGFLALVGLVLLLLNRRSAKREPIDVAQHSLTT
ncbi:tripartite tricarboxylate transporter TctB family protein [Methylobacterium radiodurans]|uniref:Tripartite tricarboxylate transporter TctB family protein n=1 Tax=Methylobacterium radiodurans TaxID=2202828 RepID=A0A2U8VME8_9HYPH|nr:tripartite tricarboxylate transporter TctB family protein [Methylobacterium radiodurans]AWN34556.1 tripartite tricarboxylate transporter TctB family protein [Methylobacterium radiodurans]